MSDNLGDINVETEPETEAAVKQNRFKSWALWLSVAGGLWVIASAFHLPEKIGLEESTFKSVLDAIGTVLVAFGIVNNPTDKTSI